MGENSHGEESMIFFIFRKKIPLLDFLSENKKDFFAARLRAVAWSRAETENALMGTIVDGGSCQCLINHHQLFLSRL